jgi:hypothetical protein
LSFAQNARRPREEANVANDTAIELEIPGPALDADRALEVLRAWIADGALVVSLEAGAFENGAEDWGRLLAEVAHHVARAQALSGTTTEAETLEAIKRSFDSSYPTQSDKMSGDIPRRVRH